MWLNERSSAVLLSTFILKLTSPDQHQLFRIHQVYLTPVASDVITTLLVVKVFLI